jgi:RNA polymerase sigma factor for flagellar operon FliA
MSTTGDAETLWREYRATGDPRLRNRLVLQYAPLVKHVTGRLRTRIPETVEQDELVSDGVLGLIDAIERFQPAPGRSFPKFAVVQIRGTIIDGLRSTDFLPRSVRDRLRSLQRARVALEEQLSRMPEDAEVALETGIPLQQVRELSRYAEQYHPDLEHLYDLDLHLGLDDLDGPEDPEGLDTTAQPGEDGPHES